MFIDINLVAHFKFFTNSSYGKVLKKLFNGRNPSTVLSWKQVSDPLFFLIQTSYYFIFIEQYIYSCGVWCLLLVESSLLNQFNDAIEAEFDAASIDNTLRLYYYTCYRLQNILFDCL